MSTFSDAVIAKADYLTSKLGPVTSIIDKLVDRLVPHATAKACGGNVLCNSYCSGSCSGNRANLYSQWATDPQGCSYNPPWCESHCGCQY